MNVAVPWMPGMTEKQYFDANLACGQMQPAGSITKIGSILLPGCGASDWRVILEPWMRDEYAERERALICQSCGKRTDITVVP